MLATGIAAIVIVSFCFPQIAVTFMVDAYMFRSGVGFNLKEVFIQAVLLSPLICFAESIAKPRQRAVYLIGAGMAVFGLCVWSAILIEPLIMTTWLVGSALQFVAGEMTFRLLEHKSGLRTVVYSTCSLVVLCLSIKLTLDYPIPRPDLTFEVPVDNGSISVDVFEPEDSDGEPAPAVVILHGVEGSTSISRRLIHFPNSRAVANRGYRTFFVRYFDNSPHISSLMEWNGRIDLERVEEIRLREYRRWITEIKTVLKAISSRPEVDQDRIALVGYSLGCFLATAIAAERGDQPFPKVIVGNFGAVWEEIEIGDNLPPMQFHNGMQDEIVEKPFVDDAFQRLRDAGVKFERYEYPNQGHVPVGIDAYEIRLITEDFLRKHLGQ